MQKTKSHFIFIAAILILSLFFLKSVLSSNFILDNVHYINDLTFLSYNTKETLEKNELPLWTPYFYSGQPLLAIPENYMFDLNFLLIYFFKNIYLAMNLSAVFYFFISGVGMYLLVYNIVGDPMAAFISAIIYMFNGFMYSFVIGGHINILEGYALLPFVFLFAHKALKGKEWFFYSVLAGIFFALQILSGSMIFFFYTAFIVGLYILFSLLNKNFTKIFLKSLVISIIMSIVALSLSAIKLLPVLEFTKMSSRAFSVSFQEFLGNPIKFSNILRIVITNLGFNDFSAAIGLVGFILVVCSFSLYKKKFVLFSIFLIILSFLLASGSFIADLIYKVPGFDKLRHVERALTLFVFAASILAAYGYMFLSEKLKKNERYAKLTNLFCIAVIFLMLVELLFLQHLPSSTKVIEPNEIKVLQHISNDKPFFRTMNLGLNEVIGHAGYNYYSQKGISEIKGGGGIWVNDYVIFLSIAQQTLSSKILSILNVKYIITDKKPQADNIKYVNEFEKCNGCAVYNAFGPYLYENVDFLPRFYVVSNSILVAGENNQVKQFIYSIIFQDWNPKNAVIIEGTRINDYDVDFLKKFNTIFLLKDSVNAGSIDKLKEYAQAGGIIVPNIFKNQNSISNDDLKLILNKTKGNFTEVNVDQYSNNKVSLNLNGQKGWLVASERFAYFPGWKASIDGNDIGLLKGNNAISSLYLNGERGKLVFEYAPESYKKGRLISSSAIIVLILFFIYSVYRKKIRHGGSNQN